MNPLTITSGGGDYRVDFCDSVAEVAKIIRTYEFILADNAVCNMHEPLSHLYLRSERFVSREHDKTMLAVTDLCMCLQKRGATKSSTLVAIGGGIVQDVATMATHLYLRGINLVLVPTTLLAMADSCIGAKCGINLGGHKNQLGCFKSPSRVLVCTEFLKTLDEEAIKSGYGEVLKLLLIAGKAFRPEDTLPFTVFSKQTVIEAALLAKKAIIEEDEYETKGSRILLNFGHTFAHALEAVAPVPHGLAVAWGIDVANFISGTQSRREVKAFIQKHLAYKIPPVDAKSLVAAMRHDKKAGADHVNLVLMERPGNLYVQSMRWADVEERVAKYLATENVYA